MWRGAIRVVLLLGVILNITMTIMDLLEFTLTGTVDLATHRLVRLELGSAVAGILAAAYLWKI